MQAHHGLHGPARAHTPSAPQPERAHHQAHGGVGQAACGGHRQRFAAWRRSPCGGRAAGEKGGAEQHQRDRHTRQRMDHRHTQHRPGDERRCHRWPADPGALAMRGVGGRGIKRNRPRRPERGQHHQRPERSLPAIEPCDSARAGSGEHAQGQARWRRWRLPMQPGENQAQGPPQRHSEHATGQRPTQALPLRAEPNPTHEQCGPARQRQGGCPQADRVRRLRFRHAHRRAAGPSRTRHARWH